MLAIILAAGKGERLLPFTRATPKSLLRIGNKTLIEHALSSLPNKIKEVIIIVSYFAEQIINKVGTNYLDLRISYVQQDPNLFGTMGALLSAKSQITSNFLVLCSDNLYDKSSLTDLILIENSFLTVRVTKEEKEKKYPFAKLSMWQTENTITLDAGAWYLSSNFLNAPAIHVRNTIEIGIPQSMKGISDKDHTSYREVVTKFWFPVGNISEVEIVERELGLTSNFYN